VFPENKGCGLGERSEEKVVVSWFIFLSGIYETTKVEGKFPGVIRAFGIEVSQFARNEL
jgi:hypothetical protein